MGLLGWLPCSGKSGSKKVHKTTFPAVPASTSTVDCKEDLKLKSAIDEQADGACQDKSGGGFGRAYKGYLSCSNQVAAIKQLNHNGSQGDREFYVEVVMLNHFKHPNLVNLFGYCQFEKQRLLVYECMPLGSLENHLHDLPPNRDPLDWITRMKIVAGVLTGLECLHDKVSPAPVIYRDLSVRTFYLGGGLSSKALWFRLCKTGSLRGLDKCINQSDGRAHTDIVLPSML